MKLYAIIDPKAKSWIEGQSLNVAQAEEKSVWIHCASLGEYNQARPLISFLEQDSFKITLSFFSPSGYNHVATCHPYYYIPLDTLENAQNFIKKINPSLAIFIRSEYWFNHIRALHQSEIPLIILNCYLSSDQYFLKWYGRWFLKHLRKVSFYYTIDSNTANHLSSVGITQNLYLGDTKVDQVICTKLKSVKFKVTEHKVILAASVEYTDRAVISELVNKLDNHTAIIIVPHEHSTETFKFYNSLTGGKLIKYSQSENTLPKFMYVDEFGILPSLYQFAWVSYIGGGFDKGIHNILESCVKLKPMIFGPKHLKFPEAKKLIDSKTAFCINKPGEILESLEYFETQNNYAKAQQACKQFLNNNKGATQKIYNHLKTSFLD